MKDECTHDPGARSAEGPTEQHGEKCNHNWRCTDSRMHEGYRRRRYKCINKGCDARQSTIEILAENSDVDLRSKNYHGRLAVALTDAQARSLLEQLQAGHRTLNLI